MRNQIGWMTVVAAALMLAGGSWAQPRRSMELPMGGLRVIAARYTSTPVVVDGKLDEAVWQNANVYLMSLGKDRVLLGQKLQEGGEVMACWDDQNLYVAVKFYDTDVCTDCKEDQTHSYGEGDTVELFIKPAHNSCYWELYATPNNKKTTFWYPSRGVSCRAASKITQRAAGCRGYQGNSERLARSRRILDRGNGDAAEGFDRVWRQV